MSEKKSVFPVILTEPVLSEVEGSGEWRDLFQEFLNDPRIDFSARPLLVASAEMTGWDEAGPVQAAGND